MEKRSRRKAAEAAITYSFSSDDEDTNNDDSLFVLEDEFKPKKRKVNSQKSKDRSDAPAKKKANCRSSERKDELTNPSFTDDACSGIRDEPCSSTNSVTTKSKRRKKQDTTCEKPRHKKIKLEASEIVPDLSKVKVERVSLTEFQSEPLVHRVKSEKSDEFNETQNDLKPNINRIKAETYFDSSDESDVDCKPNLQKIKIEKDIKEDPDMVTEKSRKKLVSKRTNVKNEVKQEGDASEPSKKIKNEVKEEPGSSQALKKPKKVKNEVKYEPDPSYQDGDFGGDSGFNKRLSCKLGEPNWETRMLSDKSHIDFPAARNIITMLKNDCTIPFIARYRRDQTGGLDADQLRHVKEAYDQIKTLETKIQNAKKKLQKIGKMSPQLERCLNGVQSLDELDFIYAPYKQGSSKSKAEKARALGLEDAAYLILNGNDQLDVIQFVDSSKDGLKTKEEVIRSIQNIVADLFAKNDEVLEYLHQLEKTVIITIKSTKTKVSEENEKDKSKKKTGNEDTMGKFEIYYDFETTTHKIQPHQMLALNRGENLKILSIKMTVSDWLQKKLSYFCERKWLRSGLNYALRTHIFRNSFNDAYSRLISPLLIRRAKSDLNHKAQSAAIENFAVNLKSLLQTPPVKGCSILGIDPGFRHGFKFALINNNGDLLWTHVFHFDVNDKNSLKNEKALYAIRERLIEYQCELIAIGNGTGCRAIEAIISHFISNDFFQPELSIQYTIVNERGASVYSCTPLAKEEFPDLDPNLVSAVFIARSLQDPLSEYVKVEPKHLGVGMYQHDVPENRLNNTLDEIVSECVSFTGVDVNTASIHLLKRISGLGMVRAANIIEWRRQNGPFRNREQLTLVNKVGQKTYEQCSGFIRIHTKNLCDEKDKAKGKSKHAKSGVNDDLNPLDTTWIHPESYTTAYLFIDKCEVDLQDLGTPAFISQVKQVVDEQSIEKIASDLNENTERIELIAEALMKPIDYDYRSQFSKPFFKKGLTEMASLTTGMVLTGVVGNVTNFGAFVDIGVDKNGLIHVSRMKNTNLQVGDRVSVEVINLEIERARIGLNLLSVLR